MNKDTRNTFTAYLLFIYGCMLIPVFLISFTSGAYGVNLIPVLIFSVLAAILTSMLFYNLKIKIRYGFRTFIYWSLLTLANIFIWMAVCEGTFIFRD